MNTTVYPCNFVNSDGKFKPRVAVNCQEDCSICGWNPLIAERRLAAKKPEAIRAAKAMMENGQKNKKC